MVTAVFIIAMLNLGLGFGLSLYVDCPWQLPLHKLPLRRREQVEPEEESVPEESEPEVDAGALKDEWQALLEQAKLEPASTVEAMLWVVYLDLPIVRACLTPIDKHWWMNQELRTEQLEEEANSWLERLDEWASVLTHHKQDPEVGQLASDFEELLLDQQYQSKSDLEALLKAGDSPASPTDVGRPLASLFNALDSVRDFVTARLGDLLRQRDHYEPIDELRSKDVESGAMSRLGLEKLFREWWEEDPERLQLTSCVLVDIDHTARINEALGSHGTDRLLAAFGELMQSLVRQDRGFDRTVRYNGQAYLFFLGDTALANASSQAERVRQTIEVSSFQVNEKGIELTASFGVAEVGRTEKLDAFLSRLEKTVRVAKEAGRDTTFADDGTGPATVNLPQYQVERQEIHVDMK